MSIKFQKHAVVSGSTKARIFYSLDNRCDGRPCVTLYAKDFDSGRALGLMFPDDYVNRTDSQSDYFDKGQANLFEGSPHYSAARARAEEIRSRR